MLFVSYHFYASYESGEMHSDYGNIFLNHSEPSNETNLHDIERLIKEDIKNRIGFKTSAVTVLNFRRIN